jgi:hypothetical protein
VFPFSTVPYILLSAFMISCFHPNLRAFLDAFNQNFPKLVTYSLHSLAYLRRSIRFLLIGVPDPWHFGTDPKPWIHTLGLRIRILIFPSVTYKQDANKK